MLNLQILTKKQASAGRRDAPVWGKNSTKAEKEFEPDGGVTAIDGEDGDGVVEQSVIDDGVIRRVEGGWPLKRDGRRDSKGRKKEELCLPYASDMKEPAATTKLGKQDRRRRVLETCVGDGKWSEPVDDVGGEMCKSDSVGLMVGRGSVGGHKLWASIMKIGGEDRRRTSVRELR
ncbi:hypothetical protein PIB30_101081, partial [Stylosanthes scabra]|nr:hypothetical protein [Stylosanthes scabra]